MINKTQPECETKLCQYETATRTRFYNGMLLTAEHLRAEQDYHREALRRFTRHLFGSGIVCGLTVPEQKTGLCIKVNPGVALDCCGNLIEVCKCITLDLSKVCKERFGSDCTAPDQKDPNKYKLEKYLVLRYTEIPVDPEPVLTPADDCKPADEKPNCQASKVREGYCLELWDDCPCPEPLPEERLEEALQRRSKESLQQAATQQPQLAQQPSGAAQPGTPARRHLDLDLPCSPCGCCESAVGLAFLTIDCETKSVTVDQKTCRRYVISPRLLGWLNSFKISQQYMSTSMLELQAQMEPGASTNLVATIVDSHQRAKEIQDLKARLDKVVKEVRKRPTPTPRVP